MYCSNCGNKVNEDSNFCVNCGNELAQSTTSAEIDVDDELVESSIEEDMLVFVGENNTYYERKWSQMETKGTSWNFAAFFLTIFWLGSRKMYREALYLSLIFLLIDFVLYLFNYQYSITTFMDPVDYAISTGAAVLLGMYGNKLYKKHAEKKVIPIRNLYGDTPDKKAMLKVKGGRSLGGAFLGFLILLCAYALPSMLIPTNIDAIEGVKYGTFYDYPEVEVGEMFADVFTEPQWRQISTDGSVDLIEFTGNKDRHVVQIQFRYDGNEFEVSNILINGDRLAVGEISEFLDYVFSEYMKWF